MANLSITIPESFESEFIAKLTHASLEAIATAKQREEAYGKEWLKQKEACQWLNISYTTLQLWRSKGLKVSVIEGITLVSKTEINRFLQAHES